MNIQQHLNIEEHGIPHAKRDAIIAEFFHETSTKKQHFLGYQTNQEVHFSDTLYPFMNINLLNLGDSFEEGSYEINSKQFERAVLHYYAKLWLFSQPHTPDQYWGYITAMGSTEGNLFALWNARDYLNGAATEVYQKTSTIKKPIVLFSSVTHYSVQKACKILGLSTFNDIGPLLGFCPINQGNWKAPLNTDESGAIKEDDLYLLAAFFIAKGYPIILLLNHGTTFSGGSDATSRIINTLKPILGNNSETNRRYWIHVDGALSANFSPYLQDSPFKTTDDPYEFRHPEVMSMCSSPYKWLGAPWVCGVYLMRKKYKIGSTHRPTYIASRDSTVSGSRQGIFGLYLWERLSTLGTKGLKEMAHKNDQIADYLYQALSKLFSAKQDQHLIVMTRPKGSNIVCFTSPNDEINRRFSLAQEHVSVNGSKQKMSHIVVLSHVTQDMIDQLIEALSSTSAFDTNKNF